MTNKLKVVELRAELAKRGLDAAGTKPLLVRRLEEAVLKENQKPVVDNVNGADADTSRKRRKESNDEDSNKVKPVGDNVNGFSASDGDNNEKRERGSDDGDLNKIEAVEKFRQMSLKQLREQASLLGIPATGTKKELLERLCKDAEMGSDYVNEKEDDSKGGRVVTAIKKASVVLDQGLPDDIKAKYHVLQQGDDAYDAMLNQTNIGDNNNKFYVIQLLDPLYFQYQQLQCELRPLEDDSEEFAMIAKYMKNTHAKTHSGYSVDIVQIFKVAREGEVECFKKFSTTKNRMLLDANKLPDGKLSTKGVGATEPDPSEAKTLDDGVIVPLGKSKEQQRQGTLLYNEYIVYNVEQIRMRYLVQVNFSYPRYP
ncbi:hypothetical protein SLEP1_g1339 [Rubroshorea leprosula]|uniref:Poly [ADP-ribose] polymerase n=1 Tax=Rubroshorea leprosula TaxID=152421 RepID=A0AAV5HDH6_9ROSI|nr:hypothetical protein SLEP1_g1339 [Rubroshorea leprosula]